MLSYKLTSPNKLMEESQILFTVCKLKHFTGTPNAGAAPGAFPLKKNTTL